MFRREDFLQHSPKRSNAESTFSAVKRKFGDRVRSRFDTAEVNESLAKPVCFNTTGPLVPGQRTCCLKRRTDFNPFAGRTD
jgi:hypothetical protein